MALCKDILNKRKMVKCFMCKEEEGVVMVEAGEIMVSLCDVCNKRYGLYDTKPDSVGYDKG